MSAALYRDRVAEMVATMRRVGARTMLLTLSQNFSEWSPAVSSHRPGLRPDDKRAWRAALKAGDALAPRYCGKAIEAWSRALAIDDGYADVHYRIAQCEQRLGHLEEAYRRYRLASDLDRLPQGASTSFNDLLRQVGRETGALVVDIDDAFTRASGARLVGFDLFVDPLHPNLRGHQLIAAAVADAIRAAGLPSSDVRWMPDRYVDPPVDSIIAAHPEFISKELLATGFACHAAARLDCSIPTLRAAAEYTTNPATRAALEKALATFASGAPEATSKIVRGLGMRPQGETDAAPPAD